MRKLYSFMVVSLDGFYEGPNGEFDWPVVDQEFNEFGIEQLHDTDALLFGRVTYEGMAAYWPTPAAREDDPVVAELMNGLPKVVVSTTLTAADWGDTRLGGGRSLFRTLGDRLPLELLQTRTFSSGNVLLTYRPA